MCKSAPERSLPYCLSQATAQLAMPHPSAATHLSVGYVKEQQKLREKVAYMASRWVLTVATVLRLGFIMVATLTRLT